MVVQHLVLSMVHCCHHVHHECCERRRQNLYVPGQNYILNAMLNVQKLDNWLDPGNATLATLE